MIPEHLRTNSPGDEPHSSKGNAANSGGIALHGSFPASKVNRSGVRREHHKLRKGQVGLLSEVRCGSKGLGAIAGQTEDEGPEDVNPMATKSTQALRQACSHAVEIFIYVFQAFRSHG